MKCLEVRRLIPDFLEGQLRAKDYDEVSAHLQACKDCAKEKRLYEESWKLMGQWQDIEPEPGFKSRFWNRLIGQTESAKAPRINIFRLPKRASFALVTAATIIIVVSVALLNYLPSRSAAILASKISEEEMILVENIDLLENLEIIQYIDLLENMEIIENLDKIDLGTV